MAGIKGKHWRIAGWSLVGLLLLTPLVAMQFTDEVQWDLRDFIVMGILLGGTGLFFEVAVRISPNPFYRAAAGIALFGSLFLVWSNLAVGIIGSENNPANVMYYGVLAVGYVIAFLLRFEAKGMARAMVAMAGAQVLVAVIALAAGMVPSGRGPLEIVVLTGLFCLIWFTSAVLFRRAAD